MTMIAVVPRGAVAGGGASVGEVIAVCERARAQGNVGVDAAACEWYAAPCDCSLLNDTPVTWCVPTTEPTERVIQRVVAALRRHPNPAAAAAPVVAGVLAELYPCPVGTDADTGSHNGSHTGPATPR